MLARLMVGAGTEHAVVGPVAQRRFLGYATYTVNLEDLILEEEGAEEPLSEAVAGLMTPVWKGYYDLHWRKCPILGQNTVAGIVDLYSESEGGVAVHCPQYRGRFELAIVALVILS